MKALLVSGGTSDETLLNIERKHVAGTALIDKDLEDGARVTNQWVDLIKNGNKLKAHLKSWLNAKPIDIDVDASS